MAPAASELSFTRTVFGRGIDFTLA
jgi:hypothetical protein